MIKHTAPDLKIYFSPVGENYVKINPDIDLLEKHFIDFSFDFGVAYHFKYKELDYNCSPVDRYEFIKTLIKNKGVYVDKFIYIRKTKQAKY